MAELQENNNDSENSKPADLGYLDLPNDFPPNEVVDDEPTINLRSINTPDLFFRTPGIYWAAL